MRQLKINNSITNRESISLIKYMQEVSKIKLLSADEEVALGQQARLGNQQARDQLVQSNLRFVVSVAKQYQGQGLSLCDLINEGNIGLIQAAGKYDETRGFRFISFAVWCIRQQIMMAIAQQAKLVRVPIHRSGLLKKIKKAAAVLEQELGRVPETPELADALQLSETEIDEALTLQQQPLSLDMPLNEEEDGGCLVDILPNHTSDPADRELQHRQSLKKDLQQQLSILTGRQKETLLYYFGIGADSPLSLDEIARKYDVTTERVRQIKDAALEKLRACCQVQLLRSYL